MHNDHIFICAFATYLFGDFSFRAGHEQITSLNRPIWLAPNENQIPFAKF